MDINQNDEIEINLKELYQVLKGKCLIIILIGLISASIAGSYSYMLIKPMYTSATMLYILNKQTDVTSVSDLELGLNLTKDYKILISSRSVLTKVIEDLSLNMEYNEMKSIISITNPPDTRILTISVHYEDPVLVKTIADKVAEVSCERIAEIMEMLPPKVFEPANAPITNGVGIIKNSVFGGFIGSFLVAVIVIIMYIMDDTIKSAEDIEKYLELNTLCILPADDNRGK